MGILSNFLWLRGAKAAEADEAAPVEVRPAFAGEVGGAIELVATRSDGGVDDGQAQLLRDIARAHQGDLGGPWVAAQGQRLLAAALPVLSPGKTMLVFGGTYAPTALHAGAVQRLLEAMCQAALGGGVHLAQALLEPTDHAGIALLAQAGFARLAELIYLQGVGARGLKEGALPAGMRWQTYSTQTHSLFSRAVLESYEESLDCPGLNGLRSIDDILAGHRATGDFDSGMWFALTCRKGDAEVPAGVLLLNRVPRASVTELVYLGVSPEFRGKGFGDALLRRALIVAGDSMCERLSLAVDAGNEPALKLYWRHGLATVGRKLALLRVLSSTGCPQVR